MTPNLDLTKRHWTHTRGPLTFIGTWYSPAEGQPFRPAMVIIRTGEEYWDETVPCIVPLDRAWVWDERIGDPAQAARTAYGFTQALRLTEGKRDLIEIASAINDFLGDLISMPPMPRDQVPVDPIVEVTVTNRTTGKAHEVVL